MTQEVATAPNDPDGHVNVSPKGGRDTFQIVDPATFAYLDLLGSGIETISHVRENGRIVIMFCAFDGPPKVLRLHGKGRVVQAHDDGFAEIVAGFDPSDAILGILRSVILVDISRIGDSCGFVVPRMELVGERTHFVEYGEHWAKENGADWKKYLRTNNQQSLDGLVGLDFPDGDNELTDVEARRLSSTGKSL